MSKWLLAVCVSLAIVAEAQGEILYPFAGNIDFAAKEVTVDFDLGEEGHLTAKVDFATEQEVHLQAALKRLKIFGNTVSSHITLNLKTDGAVYAHLAGEHSTLNGEPVDDLAGEVGFKEKTLYLSRISFAGIVYDGYLQLSDPYGINLMVDMSGVPMENFLAFWNNKKMESTGFVDGQIQVSGALDQPFLKGHLTSYGGYIKKFYYDDIVLNLEGEYPILTVANSSVTTTEGLSFNIAGNVDLTNTDNFKDEVAALTRSPLISEDTGRVEWTLKRKESGDDSTSTELKYLRQKETGVGLPDEEKSDMLGIEHKVKF